MAKKNEQYVTHIADIRTDFPQWYTDVVRQSEMVDYGPVKGTMVIRPYGYAMWENIQRELDARFKATGHKNAYFPLFIPESYLKKEAEHVEGFAPEVAWVTHGGGEELAERLCVRPTSETIICAMYAKWIQSYRDLPVLLNQWCNVVRWEKTTRPFLRTSEFLWQEGHTVHESDEEAQRETLRMLEVYREFSENVLAIPMVTGRKTDKEKFAGAVATYTIEALMQDGKALQSGTSHNLGQHFAKVFNITFQNREGREEFGYQTSWGVSTRLIGALVMVHGDQRGLVLPPMVAPLQAVVVPVAAHKGGVTEACERVREQLEGAGIRVLLDDRDTLSPGWKFNEWELKGVPLRIEIGPRDIESGQALTMRRDTLTKSPMPLDGIAEAVSARLSEIQRDMLKKAQDYLHNHFCDAADLDAMGAALDAGKGYIRAMWCGDRACEDAVKDRFAASARCMPFDQTPVGDRCVVCGKPADTLVYWARAY
ncbi:MAG: proline--tRNA ligase [Clostridiales bacterium]|nr:proline--tRNA ligase [Clostridiales bacterium]